jgi:hypothetical protein
MNKKFMIYKIKKGSHYSRIPFPVLCFGDEMIFDVTFFESCRYSTVLPSNQTDANKLFGFTEGLTLEHKDSARFGWHYDLKTKKIVLHAYCYVGGVRKNTEIGSVEIGVPINLGIKRFKDEYVFSMNGDVIGKVEKYTGGIYYINFKLFPYFGGDEVAPHDILIELK